MSAATPVGIAELTWPEVRARLDAGWTTIVLPLGATEQHGRHLPLSVDTEIAGHLAEAVAARLGHGLVAPVVAPGCSALRNELSTPVLPWGRPGDARRPPPRVAIGAASESIEATVVTDTV